MGVSIIDMVTGDVLEDSSTVSPEIAHRPTAYDREISRTPKNPTPDMGGSFGNVTPGLQIVEIGQKPGTGRDHQMPPPQYNPNRHDKIIGKLSPA